MKKSTSLLLSFFSLKCDNVIFLCCQVSGLRAAQALELDKDIMKNSPKPPSLRSFVGTNTFFSAQEKERQRRKHLSADYRFTRRVRHIQKVFCCHEP